MFYRIIKIILTICLLLTGVAFAADYTLQWEHNPPSDGVDFYRIYWREYQPPEQMTPEYDICETCFESQSEGFVCPDEWLFTPDVKPCKDVGYVNEVLITDLPDISLCFAIIAVDSTVGHTYDEDGEKYDSIIEYESDFSNQVCVNLVKSKIK